MLIASSLNLKLAKGLVMAKAYWKASFEGTNPNHLLDLPIYFPYVTNVGAKYTCV
jgi:hypothetical protein